MKIFFFFFLLFFPFVQALAITPTSIDITTGTQAEVHIYNTLDQDIQIEVDGVHKENFSLAAREEKVIHFSLQEKRPGIYEGELVVKEIYENGFVNAIEIPILYGGRFPEKKEKSFENILSVFVLICVLTFGIVYVWKKKRKKHV